jgi:acyl dehydratase
MGPSGQSLDIQRLGELPVDPVPYAAQQHEVTEMLRLGCSDGHCAKCCSSHDQMPSPDFVSRRERTPTDGRANWRPQSAGAVGSTAVTRYFDDFPVDATYELGKKTVTEDEILRFGREFDPQVFHTDPEAALQSSFGGLVASGWHTCAIHMRLFVDSLLSDTATLGGVGVDEMRWLVPVRPGDTLSGRATVIGATPSRTKPQRGTVGMRLELSNQDEKLVWFAIVWSLIAVYPDELAT